MKTDKGRAFVHGGANEEKKKKKKGEAGSRKSGERGKRGRTFNAPVQKKKIRNSLNRINMTKGGEGLITQRQQGPKNKKEKNQRWRLAKKRRGARQKKFSTKPQGDLRGRGGGGGCVRRGGEAKALFYNRRGRKIRDVPLAEKKGLHHLHGKKTRATLGGGGTEIHQEKKKRKKVLVHQKKKKKKKKQTKTKIEKKQKQKSLSGRLRAKKTNTFEKGGVFCEFPQGLTARWRKENPVNGRSYCACLKKKREKKK